MKVDHVLILAAGKGTRMGEIGKVLPKVIWPIFKKSILELEIDYAKVLAPTADVYINVYNYKNHIIDFCKEHSLNSKAEILEEQEVLDIGGAIHNLARKVAYKGNVLILNSDQFLFFAPEIFNQSLEKLKTLDSVLFTYEVNSNDGYNALEIRDELFQRVILNKELKSDTTIQTYTGMSLINLEKLTPVPGESRYFDSIANSAHNKVGTKLLPNIEYWDFGTLERYRSSIKNILNKGDSAFVKFLAAVNALDYKSLKSKFDQEVPLELGSLKMYSDRLEYQGIITYF